MHQLKSYTGLGSMKIIKGTSRQQVQFTSLDDLIATTNPVRIIDAFVDKLELSQMGIKQHSNKRQIDSGGAPTFH